MRLRGLHVCILNTLLSQSYWFVVAHSTLATTAIERLESSSFTLHQSCNSSSGNYSKATSVLAVFSCWMLFYINNCS